MPAEQLLTLSAISFLLPLSLSLSFRVGAQICYNYCVDEDAGYNYFGTEYGEEVCLLLPHCLINCCARGGLPSEECGRLVKGGCKPEGFCPLPSRFQ